MASDDGTPAPRSRAFVDRLATYVLPAASVAVAALVILGPGAPRMAAGVRLWGAPAAGGEALAVRVEGIRRLFGVEDAAALEGLEVTATAAGAPLGRWSGATGPDGIAEARLTPAGAALEEPVVVRVAARGEALLEARVPLAPPGAAAGGGAGLPGGGLFAGVAEGALVIEVEAARGPLAAPFRAALRVRVREGGAPAAGARVEVTAAGADLAGAVGEGAATLVADAAGAATLELEPRAHAVELSLRASRDAASGRWEGQLPVVPGAIWLAPPAPGGAPRRLRLVSPAPRERAYVSIHGDRGRLAGAVVPLAPDGAGFFAGDAEVDLGPSAGAARWAVVAGDPYEQGAGAAAWRLGSAERFAAPPRIALLADGVPLAEARESARAGRARRAGLVVLGAAAVAEVLLLLLRSRSARRRLEAHLAQAAEGDGAGAPDGDAPLPAEDRARLVAAARAEPLIGVLALAALVALAFAIVAALATFR